ncbi:MAG: hypothetical protein IPI67_30080 [Myxococcales bacterium]|nr:hypothetical protein [Myxococcales bacterium]
MRRQSERGGPDWQGRGLSTTGINRVRGRNRAKRALAALTDSMAFSTLAELRTLRADA